jgi:hypothetical protein
MLNIEEADIGGARVRRIFRNGDQMLRAGTMLSADQVLSIPPANRRALAEAGFIELYPRPIIESVGIGSNAERHIVHMGGGKYDVIAGIKLNDGPLTKDEAEDLATKPGQ